MEENKNAPFGWLRYKTDDKNEVIAVYCQFDTSSLVPNLGTRV